MGSGASIGALRMVVAIVGAVLGGLSWLLILGLVLSVLTAVWGWGEETTRH